MTVTSHCRELLPHVFTLIACIATGDGHFLWHYLLAETATRLFTGTMLYAVRTFLLPIKSGRDSPACSDAKVGKSDLKM